MEHVTFGRSGLRMPRAILGTMTFGEQGGVGAPIQDCRAILDAYLDVGGTAVDTASNYRGGASEEFLGELLASRRGEVILASKYTVTRNPADPNAAGNSRRNLRASLEQSLARLRTDHVDVLWVHMWDRRTPIEETMRALDDAVSAGKVLYVGISDTPAWVIAEANTLADWRGWSPFIGIQVPYSLLARDVERDLLPMAGALGLSAAAWSPLGGGLLTGKYAAGQAASTARLRGHTPTRREQRVIATVQAVASEAGATPAQVALAWVLSRGTNVHPIIGARTIDQLADNLAALTLTLPDEALTQLNDASAIELGFPHDFISANASWVLGAADTCGGRDGQDLDIRRPAPR
ncbi:MAG: aldo/keto reductase [Actinobacteria bacterium]|nr:aldo/keto reductase [Actinomycetota bacterium]